MEFIKDNFTLWYHLEKANKVVDALSRKSLQAASLMIKEAKMIEYFRNLLGLQMIILCNCLKT